MSIRYIVDDVADAIAFYEGHLGFEVKLHPASGFAMLSEGNLRLLLNAAGAGGGGQAAGEGAVPRPGGWARFQVRTEDLDTMVERLSSAGVTFRTSIVEGTGGRQALAEDPSGNPVELFEPAEPGAAPARGNR